MTWCWLHSVFDNQWEDAKLLEEVLAAERQAVQEVKERE
jgi:hypothetical protein